jgi:hypothetical protein
MRISAAKSANYHRNSSVTKPLHAKKRLLSTYAGNAKKKVFQLKTRFFGLVLESFSPVIHKTTKCDILSHFCELTKRQVALSFPGLLTGREAFRPAGW